MVEKNIDAKIKKMLKNKVILVTGGSGSVGSVLVKKLLEYPVNKSEFLILMNILYSN